jgi:hypothetical protein
VKQAVRVWHADTGRRGGKIPHWEVVAFWFAAQAVRLAARLRSPLTSAQLAEHIADWRKSFRTALGWFITGRFAENYEQPQNCHPDMHLWWGYRADLRHAGVFREPEVLRTAWRGHGTARAAAQSALPGLWASCCAGLHDIVALVTFALPSNWRGRLPLLSEDQPTEGSECTGQPAE